MRIEISAKNMTISPASQDLIARYVQQLRKYFRRIYTIRWSFETVQPLIKTYLFIHAHSGDYRASASGMTIRELLAGACRRIERQRRRRKRMAERTRRRNSLKSSRLTKIAPDDDAFREPDDFVD